VARPFAKRKQQQKKKTGFLLPLATSEAGKKNSSSLPKTRVLLFVAMNALPCISSLAAIEAMVVQQIQESPEHHVLVFLDIDETIFESALLVDCAAVANRAAFMAFYKLIEDLAGVKTRSELTHALRASFVPSARSNPRRAPSWSVWAIWPACGWSGGTLASRSFPPFTPQPSALE
jgi:hypothetical protein